MASALRVGISPCPNDVYVFAGLITGNVSWDGAPLAFEYEDVQTLNEQAQTGAFDIVKISYAAYRTVSDAYDLLDCGGALGRGVGPLLLRKGNANFDFGAEIMVPGEQTTANFLLDFYLRTQGITNPRKRFVSYDVLYRELCNHEGAQGVVIHEARFTFERDGLTLLQDLGEFWEGQTGYAIPLGAVLARRDVPGLREKAEHIIRESIAWSDAHPDAVLDLCRQHAQEMTDSVMRQHIDLYVNADTRGLTDAGQASIRFFLEKQKEFGQAG